MILRNSNIHTAHLNLHDTTAEFSDVEFSDAEIRITESSIVNFSTCYFCDCKFSFDSDETRQKFAESFKSGVNIIDLKSAQTIGL